MIAVRNTFVAAAELEPGVGVWARARGFWRMARVVRVKKTRAVVVFRLASAPRVVRQTVPLEDLRPWTWEPPQGAGKHVPPPLMAEAQAADLRP